MMRAVPALKTHTTTHPTLALSTKLPSCLMLSMSCTSPTSDAVDSLNLHAWGFCRQ